MAVSFENIKVGMEYNRPYLTKLWGYKGNQALYRGVITPSKCNLIVLFVTKEKQQSFTQYNDYIKNGFLYWEGEKKNASDKRIINASSNGDKIHLFYREKHHKPFIYYGEIFLKDYSLNNTNNHSPSKFEFYIDNQVLSKKPVNYIRQYRNETKSNTETEQESIVKSRIGQGIFRNRIINFWETCSITGLSNLSLLKASHVKPWRNSKNQERLDPMNGLLLPPTLDHLFDNGFITFDQNGLIEISEKLSADDMKVLKIDATLKLRVMPSKLKEYMEYHRQFVFKN